MRDGVGDGGVKIGERGLGKRVGEGEDGGCVLDFLKRGKRFGGKGVGG